MNQSEQFMTQMQANMKQASSGSFLQKHVQVQFYHKKLRQNTYSIYKKMPTNHLYFCFDIIFMTIKHSHYHNVFVIHVINNGDSCYWYKIHCTIIIITI